MKRCIRIHKSATINFLFSALSASSAVIYLVLLTSVTHAASVVLRDSIGPDSSLTDGLGGGSTLHAGGSWATSAFVVDVPVTESGILTEAQIVIFARDFDLNPENDLEDIYDFSMDFHLWSDGVQGGPGSFFDNAIGNPVAEHLAVSVNSTSSSVITVEEFGTTGPAINPTQFKTYLVTIDLASFGIALQSGEQYVAAVIDPGIGPVGSGALFRVIGSRATGFEDLFQQFDTDPNLYPGFLASQHNNPFEQYAAKLTLGNGDFDEDDDVDGRDFLTWQRSFGGSVAPEQDTNGDGIANEKDLNVWEAMYGQNWAGASSSITVPEPGGATLLLLAALGFLNRREHRGHRGKMGACTHTLQLVPRRRWVQSLQFTME